MEPAAARMADNSRRKRGFLTSRAGRQRRRKRSIGGSCRNPVRTACAQRSDYRRGTSTSPRAAATFAALARDRLRSPDTNRSNWAGATPAALPSA
jgi:hypothetical protein